MPTEIPVRGVIHLDQMQGTDPEDSALLKNMAVDAEEYLRSFAWCRSIENRYFGAGVGKVVALFLFEIVPSAVGIDRWLWVVVGDLPSAYLATDDCKSPSEALSGYIFEMKRWVELAKQGKTSDDVIPVNAPATPEWGIELDRRLEYLQLNILPFFREAEIERA